MTPFVDIEFIWQIWLIYRGCPFVGWNDKLILHSVFHTCSTESILTIGRNCDVFQKIWISVAYKHFSRYFKEWTLTLRLLFFEKRTYVFLIHLDLGWLVRSAVKVRAKRHFHRLCVVVVRRQHEPFPDREEQLRPSGDHCEVHSDNTDAGQRRTEPVRVEDQSGGVPIPQWVMGLTFFTFSNLWSTFFFQPSKKTLFLRKDSVIFIFLSEKQPARTVLFTQKVLALFFLGPFVSDIAFPSAFFVNVCVVPERAFPAGNMRRVGHGLFTPLNQGSTNVFPEGHITQQSEGRTSYVMRLFWVMLHSRRFSKQDVFRKYIIFSLLTNCLRGPELARWP